MAAGNQEEKGICSLFVIAAKTINNTSRKDIHINGPSQSSNECSSINESERFRLVTGLLIGHCHLNRHLELMGIVTYSECRWCLKYKKPQIISSLTIWIDSCVEETYEEVYLTLQRHSEDGAHEALIFCQL